MARNHLRRHDFGRQFRLLSKIGDGTLEIDAAPSLASGSALVAGGGTLRLNYSSAPSLGTGVSATVAGGAMLELAGSAPQLGQSVNVANSGTLLDSSGANQYVGAVTGPATRWSMAAAI